MSEWRPVPGFEGCYEVSDDGRVRSLDRRVRTATGTRLVQGQQILCRTNDKGYRHVHLSRDNKVRVWRICRLVLETFRGKAPTPKYEASHLNGDRSDDRVENLVWETHQENQSRIKQHGTSPLGERHGNSLLTRDQVLTIKGQLAAGEEHEKIASAFGISRSAVGDINTGRTWRHVGHPIHRARRNRSMRGDGHPQSKLNDQAAKVLRHLRGKRSQSLLALLHGVSRTTVWKVQLQERWSDHD